ncbi:MAG: hypothetical protein IEMM0008_1530 [bacterium]|nr:MAG: hypothetical protein IEMM0008_1530 [bacterium]
MKLASLKRGGRDGRLIVVDRKLERAVEVTEIARTFQQAIDQWDRTEDRLREVYNKINLNPQIDRSFDFVTKDLSSPSKGLSMG